MDARDQLKRYLEQRRDMGERELVLDGLTVDEALRILGASAAAPAQKTARQESSSVPPTVEREAPVGAPVDWRETLRAAGAAPGDLMAGKPIKAAPEQAPDELPSGLTVGTPSRELFGGPMALLDSLEKLAAHVASCTRCPLYSTATNPVPGEGNPNADFMCVGEAPGATEDETGRPFVGAAGQLLTKILGAIDLKREDVYICNVLKHRPPGNRNPRPEEVTACGPYLIRQIELIRPKVILALGTFAAQTLLDTKLSIGKLRGQVHRYYGVPLVVTYHPAALLRNPGWKRPTWEDVQLARRILDSAASTGA
ncbi:MAG TPA: uracil-DNA glycosylase [Gemmatimonadaceae bacterium]|nr:uracil-DNA glycosylase [Gemmatimonadaceae bacterium]